jgi:hypothetical protein
MADGSADTTDTPPVVEVDPAPFETAVVNFPPRTIVRVVREGREPRDFGDTFYDPGEPAQVPYIAEFPAPELGGAVIVRCGGLASLRNGRHSRDRAVWRGAVRLIRDGGVAYVLHEQRDWFGRQVWWAVSVRTEAGQ